MKLLFTILLIILSFNSVQAYELDSLFNANSEKIDSLRLKEYVRYIWYNPNGPDKEFEEIIDSILVITKSINEKEYYNYSYFFVGEACIYSGRFSKALHYFSLAQLYNDIKNDVKRTAGTISNIASILKKNNYTKQSFEKYSELLTYAKANNDTLFIVNALINIGDIYDKWGDDNKALELFNESLKIAENDTASKISTLSFLGSFNFLNGDYEKALEIFLYADNLRDQNKSIYNFQSFVQGQINIAETYIALGEPDKAKKFIDRGFQYSVIYKEKFLLISLNNVLSKYYFALGKEKLGLDKMNEALEQAKRNNKLFLLEPIYKDLSNYYITKKNHKLSSFYLQKLLQVKDSLNQRELTLLLDNIENSQEYENLKKENQELKVKQRIEKIQLKNSKNTNYLLFLIITLSLGILALLYYRFRAMNNLKVELERSEENYKLLNNTKNKLLSAFAEDLSKPMNEISNYIENNELEKAKVEIHDYQIMLNNLMSWGDTQVGGIKINLVEYPISDIVETTVEHLSKKAESKQIIIKNQVKSQLCIFDKDMMHIILRNLISNAIKFSPVNSSVEILSEKVGEKLKISIKDEGIGMSNEKAKEILEFNMNSQKGLGLLIVKTYLDLHGESLEIDSIPNVGTTVSFTLKSKSQ